MSWVYFNLKLLKLKNYATLSSGNDFLKWFCLLFILLYRAHLINNRSFRRSNVYSHTPDHQFNTRRRVPIPSKKEDKSESFMFFFRIFFLWGPFSPFKLEKNWTCDISPILLHLSSNLPSVVQYTFLQILFNFKYFIHRFLLVVVRF